MEQRKLHFSVNWSTTHLGALVSAAKLGNPFPPVATLVTGTSA